MKQIKKMIVFVLVFLLAVPPACAYASEDVKKSAEDSGIISDEEWNEVENEISEDDPDENWDHETWDYEHKELAWTVFGSTEWTSSSFPNLNFSNYGIGSYEVKNLSDDVKNTVTEAVTNYKYATGMYTQKKVEDDGTITVDNSAYVTLVLACMDVLSQRGDISDLYAFADYVYCYRNKDGEYITSPAYCAENEQCHVNVARFLLRRIVSGERFYNAVHTEKASIYSKDNAGIYFMVQSAVYNTTYANHKDAGETAYCGTYSEEDAAAFFEYTGRGAAGYSEWNSFAKDVLDGYSCGAVEGTYVMDAFGRRVDANGNFPAANGDGGGTGATVTLDLTGIKLDANEPYKVCDSPLTKKMGVKMFNGHKETYYSETVLPGPGLKIPGRHVAKDGTIRDSDGYICVAAAETYLAKGSTLLTSLGPAKVYDCGCDHGTIDIYVNSTIFK